MTKTGVWWDIDTCKVPQGVDRYQVRQRIELALENYLPLTISAIGNLNRIPEADLKPILSTGFFTKHVRDGSVGILKDMNRWASNNPPPATLILISDRDDKHTSRILNLLRDGKYTIIRAYANFRSVTPDYASKILSWVDLFSDSAWINYPKKKYSETPWFCYTCIYSARTYAGESFESLTRHLKSQEHCFEECKYLPREEDSSSLPKKTGVWWDVDTCLPPEYDPYRVRQSIESAFKEYRPLTISAIGNLKRIPHPLLEPILSSGISMKHCHCGKSSIMMEMSLWAQNNPPPATLILISDREENFVGSGLLPSFKERGYTIVRAFQKHPKVPPIYASQTILWDYLLQAWHGDTNQEVKDKCSETAWHCDLCIYSGHPFAGEKLESLASHLESEEHGFQELKQGLKQMPKASTQSKKTRVWWDIDTCQVPQRFDPSQVRQRIESAFSHLLPFTISAIGNLTPIPSSVLEPIFSTGIILTHDQDGWISIAWDMERWTDKNPPPATLILISDREEYFELCGIHSFVDRGYTIIRAFQKHPNVPPNYASRTILWDYLLPDSAMNEDTNQEFKDNNTLSETAWHCHCHTCLISGNDFTGKCFESLTRHLESEEHGFQEFMSMPLEEEASTQSKKAITVAKRQSEAKSQHFSFKD